MSLSSATDQSVIDAIALRFCRHFPALNMAHGLGRGIPDPKWGLVHGATPQAMIDEARSRGIDLESIETAMSGCECCPGRVVDTDLFSKCSEPK